MKHCYYLALALLTILPASFVFPQTPTAGTKHSVRESVHTEESRPQEEKFVRGQLTFLLSKTGLIRWDVGNGSDYLPLQLAVNSISGSERISVTVIDQTFAPLKREGLPPNVLSRYYRILAGRGIKALNATVSLSYSEADLKAAGITDETVLRVYQIVGDRWIQRKVSERNVEGNTITIAGIDLLSDIIISGASGPLFKPAAERIDFGSLKAGATKWRSVTIRNAGADSLKIINVTSTNELFTVASLEEHDDGWHLNTAFRPVEDGMVEGLLIVEHNAESSPDTLIVSGIGMAPVFILQQSRMDFGKVPVNAVARDTLSVSNYGSDTLVVSLSSAHPVYDVTPMYAVIPPSGAGRFAVTFKPKQSGGQEGALLFSHNAPGKVYEVNLYGIGAAPLFAASTPSLDLGSVHVQEHVARRVIIRNVGNASLEISSVASNNPSFRVQPRDASIAEGDTASFTVSYSAGSATGHRRGLLIFSHNALKRADTLRVEVSVTVKTEELLSVVPETFVLRNNYPNPFNPVTTIEYGVPEEAQITLRVFTMLGVEVRTLTSALYQPGFYSVTWDATNDRGLEVATGMYFYRLEAQPTKEGEKPFVQVRKMLFVK